MLKERRFAIAVQSKSRRLTPSLSVTLGLRSGANKNATSSDVRVLALRDWLGGDCKAPLLGQAWLNPFSTVSQLSNSNPQLSSFALRDWLVGDCKAPLLEHAWLTVFP